MHSHDTEIDDRRQGSQHTQTGFSWTVVMLFTTGRKSIDLRFTDLYDDDCNAKVPDAIFLAVVRDCYLSGVRKLYNSGLCRSGGD